MSLDAQNASLVMIWEMEVETVTGIWFLGCSEYYYGDDLGYGSGENYRDLAPRMLILQVW